VGVPDRPKTVRDASWWEMAVFDAPPETIVGSICQALAETELFFGSTVTATAAGASFFSLVRVTRE
jgi:hypothetical protein